MPPGAGYPTAITRAGTAVVRTSIPAIAKVALIATRTCEQRLFGFDLMTISSWVVFDRGRRPRIISRVRRDWRIAGVGTRPARRTTSEHRYGGVVRRRRPGASGRLVADGGRKPHQRKRHDASSAGRRTLFTLPLVGDCDPR